ncbi:lactonase family protein [Paenibacillus sp. PL2-23]|uniref:lactonase family protein n=1 Tax=Paenibacillus sp. PL2-23 TaxID=2100729 RepID=UPI0030F8F41F
MSKELLIFTGAYAEEADKGIGVYRMNEETGQLTELRHFAGLKNPTFIHVDMDNSRLYAISEGVNEEGKKIGEAAAFQIGDDRTSLTLINRKPTVQATTCHIQKDAHNRFLTVTSYHGGMTGLLGLDADGGIGELLDVVQHEGSSVHPNQDRPHPHSSFYSPDGQYLFVQDLGLDLIVTYRLDAEGGKLIPHHETKLQPGSGPRHLAIRPGGAFAYVINELNSTVTAFGYDADAGKLTELQTISTLPMDYQGDNGCAEIAVSSDGRFLYGSNRGHDSIVVYSIDEESGKLNVIQHMSVGGGHPRHFALTPSGDYLIAANRDTNNLVTFRVDRLAGTLTPTGHELEASKPVCVIPVYA